MFLSFKILTQSVPTYLLTIVELDDLHFLGFVFVIMKVVLQ